MFTAGLVFTPGGDDRINSLQDEDTLTGTGTNPTLNATVGNANDNGGNIITPTLNNIQTLNAAFTGAGGSAANGPVNVIDLQDATGLTTINTTRVSSGLGATGFTFANLSSAATNSFGISGVAVKTTANFDFQEGVLADAGQSASFRLSSVQLNQLNAHNNAGGAGSPLVGTTEGFENVTITSTGGNQVDRLTVAQMRNLTLEGAGSLGINNFSANAIQAGVTDLGTTTEVGAAEFQERAGQAPIVNVNAPLERITGTTATGALSIDITNFTALQTDPANSGRPVFLNFQGGTAADKIIHATAIGDASVTINGGAGNDTLASYANVLDVNPLNATNPDITSVENLEVRTQNSTGINIDLSEIGGLTNTLLRNENAATTATTFGLLEVSQEQANNLSINHGATRGNGINVAGAGDATTVRVNLNDASGANDTVAIRLVTDQNNNVRFNFALDADGNQFAEQFAVAPGGAPLFGSDLNRVGNPALDANNQPIVARVENITINDTDAESNAIELTRALTNTAENANNHRGTITINGGLANQFMNLDATVNAYRWDQSGSALDGGTGSPTITAINGRATNGSRTGVTNADAERLVAARIDSSTYLGDVVLRVSDNLAAGSLGGQNITFGAGNDTVIFDQVIATALNRNTAGLTISDTVSGGAGTDILAIDGHAFNVTITASEWTNVSGFEVIRLLGNATNVNVGVNDGNADGNNARAAVNSYNLTLTNDLLANNGTADGGVKRIIIVNDNDATNDRADTANDTGNTPGNNGQRNIATNTGVESGVTIDARTLTASNSFEYRGEEGNSNTADRFILADANINGAAIIDGGAASNVTTVTAGIDADSVANRDVLEARNSSTVSAGDLANVSNVGTLEFTNDTAAVQNSILVVDDSIVDRLVDAYQTSRVQNLGLAVPIQQNQERLVVKAIDNLLVNGATTGLTLQADSLTGRSAVDAFLGRGQHSIVTNGGNDRVVLLGGFVAGTYNTLRFGEQINDFALAAPTVNNFTGTINLGAQTGVVGGTAVSDSLETFGNINLAGATLSGIELMTANSDVTLNESHLSNTTAVGTSGTNILGALTFSDPAATPHTLTITNDAAVALTIDLAKITSAAAITLTLNGVATTGAIQGGGQVTIGGATALANTLTGTAGNDNIDGLAGDDVISGLAGNDSIVGGLGNDNITAGEGADAVRIGEGQDTVSLVETVAAIDTLQFSTAFAAGNANASTITGFANGAGVDTFDIGFALKHGTLEFGLGIGAANTIAASAPVTVANNGTTAADTGVVFLLSGANDEMAAGSTLANAVANAVTALKSGTDFAAANVATGDSLVVVLDDGTNSFVFHYVADGTAAITDAADLELIGVINGVGDAGSFMTGDFI